METNTTELTVNLDTVRASACIGNGRLELELGSSLRLRRLRAPSAGTDWIPAPPGYAWGTDTFHAALITNDKRERHPVVDHGYRGFPRRRP